MKPPRSGKSVLAAYAPALLGLALFMASSCAFADSNPGNGLLDDAIGRFKTATSRWEGAMTTAASSMFWTLALINLVWSMSQSALKRAEFQEIFAELFRWIMFTGFFYWLLLNGSTFAGLIVSSLKQLAGTATGDSDLSPSAIVSIGFDIFGKVIENSSALDPVVSACGILIGAVVLCVLALIAANMAVLLVSIWILSFAGIIFLGFGGGKWTSDMAINFFRTMLSTAASYFGMILVVGIGQEFITSYYASLSDLDLQGMGAMLVASVFLYFASQKVPSLLASIASPGGGNAAGSFGAGSLLAAGAMGGAAAAAAGGLLSATAANAAGGVSSLRAAMSAASASGSAGGALSAATGMASGNTGVASAGSLGDAMGSAGGSASGGSGGRFGGGSGGGSDGSTSGAPVGGSASGTTASNASSGNADTPAETESAVDEDEVAGEQPFGSADSDSGDAAVPARAEPSETDAAGGYSAQGGDGAESTAQAAQPDESPSSAPVEPRAESSGAPAPDPAKAETANADAAPADAPKPKGIAGQLAAGAGRMLSAKAGAIADRAKERMEASTLGRLAEEIRNPGTEAQLRQDKKDIAAAPAAEMKANAEKARTFMGNMDTLASEGAGAEPTMNKETPASSDKASQEINEEIAAFRDKAA